MPTISLVTPVLAGLDEYLPALYESIETQQMPDGWKWEWLVQEDGETTDPARRLPDDPRIHFDTGTRGRAATARTLALARATGELMRTVDADDILLPGALARDIDALTTNPAIGWVVSPAVDLWPSGETVTGPRDPESGPLPDRALYNGESRGLLPVLGCTLAAHSDLIRAVGGWQALPVDEDVALLVAVEAVAPGWMLAEPSIYYRKWPGQTTSGRDASGEAPDSPRRRVILDRADVLRRSGWRWKPPALK